MFDPESYFGISVQPDSSVWEITTRHAVNAVSASPYFSDRGGSGAPYDEV